MIGQLNRRITIKSWGSAQDESGGVSSVETNSYIMWGLVENRSGMLFTGEQQRQWSYDYKVTFRYEKSRLVNSNNTIDYDGKRLAINSLSILDEGNRTYYVARCSTTDLIPIDNSGGSGGGGSSNNGLNLLFRVGDSDAPVADETEFIITQLIGLNTSQFSVFRNGLPMYPETEFSFDSSNGKITLVIPGDKFILGEQFLIK